MKKHIIILCLIFYSLPFLAQKYYLSDYGTAEGLANQKVNVVYQDTFGQMWIGTDGGLHLFNGRDFKLIKRGIPSRYIRDIEKMGNGMIVISHDAGLSFGKPRLDSLEIIESLTTENANKDLSIKYPNNLFIDKKGRVWISTPEGQLVRYDGKDYEVIITEEQDNKDSKAHYSFTSINESEFIISSPQGSIYFWDNEEEDLIFVQKTIPIIDILYKDGKLYMAGDELVIANWSENPPSLNIEWKSERSDLNFTSLAIDTLGRLYTGTHNSGLYQISALPNSFLLSEVFSNNDPHRVDRLPFKGINSIFITKDNSIWVCADEGLGLLQRRFFEGTHNLPNDNATTLAIANNGNIYVAMGDVYKIIKSGQEFNGQKLNLPNVGAFNALAVSGNDLWSGTNNGNLVRMDLDGNQKKIYPFTDRGAGIFRICADHKNRKWFCQAPKGKPLNGVAMIDEKGEIKMYGKEKGLDNRMLIVKESPKKEIYTAGIGPLTYLYKYLPDRDEFVNMSIPFNFYISPNFEVHDIAIDDKGLVWLATTDGLLRHDMENIIRPDLGPQYTGKEIRSVAVLPDSSLWMSTDIYGMLRYKNGEVLAFGEDSGLPTKIMAYRGIIADQDNKLWINTLEGVAHSSQNLPKPFPTPKPVILNTTYNSKDLELHLSPTEIISGDELKMDFISFAYPGNLTEYQYKINSSTEDNWISLGNQNSVALKIDDPEIMGLEIRARKTGGYGWSNPEKIPLKVRLPWHQRQSSQLILGLLTLAAFYILWKANSKKYKKKIINLESQLEEKDHLLIKERQEMEIIQKNENTADDHDSESMLSSYLQLVYEVSENTDAGMKWDHILEHLSLAILKLPHTVAFEIGILNKSTNRFLIEGYSHFRQGFYQREEEWSKPNSVFVDAIKNQEVMCHNSEFSDKDGVFKWTGKYITIVTAPFILPEKRDAVMCFYGNENLNNEYLIKTIKALANYFELLS